MSKRKRRRKEEKNEEVEKIIEKGINILETKRRDERAQRSCSEDVAPLTMGCCSDVEVCKAGCCEKVHRTAWQDCNSSTKYTAGGIKYKDGKRRSIKRKERKSYSVWKRTEANGKSESDGTRPALEGSDCVKKKEW